MPKTKHLIYELDGSNPPKHYAVIPGADRAHLVSPTVNTGDYYTHLGKTVREAGYPDKVSHASSTFVLVKQPKIELPNKYIRTITNKDGESMQVDVYDVLEAFPTMCPAISHALKKMLCTGLRGHKDTAEDIDDVLASMQRAKQLQANRSKA